MRSCPPLVVVTPCSATKRKQPAHAPGYADLSDPVKRSRIMEQFSELPVPARDLYLGRHHLMVVKAVDRLRAAYPEAQTKLLIISAGYGVLQEYETVVPYNATFSGLRREEVNRRAHELDIRSRLSVELGGVPVAIFLLSEAYLKAIEAPIASAVQEIYFAIPQPKFEGNGIVHIGVGSAVAKQLHSSPRMIKAVLFDKLVDQIIEEGWQTAFDDLLRGGIIQPHATRAMPKQRRLFAK